MYQVLTWHIVAGKWYANNFPKLKFQTHLLKEKLDNPGHLPGVVEDVVSVTSIVFITVTSFKEVVRPPGRGIDAFGMMKNIETMINIPWEDVIPPTASLAVIFLK